MADNSISRDSSLDPLTLPSSPLAARSHNANAFPGRRRPRPAKPPQQAIAKPIASPSRSFIMDTGPAENGASPWRIKVTVEAEPSSSPTKKQAVRTMKVPLKGMESSSPAKPKPKAKGKKGTPARRKSTAATDDSGVETDVGQKKRKGTPVRRRRSTRANPVVDEVDDDVDDGAPMATSTPAKKPARRTPARKKAAESSKQVEEQQPKSQDDASIQKLEVEALTNNKENTVPIPADEQDEDVDVEDAPGDMTIANDEDFTMVSVETLQSMKNDSSRLLENSGIELGGGVEKSAVSVSYLPSSPPAMRVREVERVGEEVEQVRYPDISFQAFEVEEKKASSPAPQPVNDIPVAPQSASHINTGSTEDQPIILPADDAQEGAEDNADDSDGEADPELAAEDDIWAEEASRSLEEESESRRHPRPQQRSQDHSPKLVDLFGSEPLRPPRPKIPRTWRRTSGVDFSYVDSPEHGALRKVSTSTEGGGSGVLTPPSTDDEDDQTEADAHHDQNSAQEEEHEAEEEDELDIELTQPDAAATQLQAEALSPGSTSSSASSPDNEGEDTGLFWQTHLPNVYESRRQRPRYQRQQRAMDLSELLNLHKKTSPVKASSVEAGRKDRRDLTAAAGKTLPLARDPLSRFRNYGDGAAAAASKAQEKVVSSPLRKSLLKGSKIGGSSLPDVSGRHDSAGPASYRSQSSGADSSISEESEQIEESVSESAMESFDSVASDQRQLLAEMGMATVDPRKAEKEDAEEEEESTGTYEESEYEISSHIRHEERAESENEESIEDDGDDEETERFSEHLSRSYEEHLNIESPQKIRVKFNDSTTTAAATTSTSNTSSSTTGGSSLLAPRKEYPPLFGEQQQPPKKEYPPLFGRRLSSAASASQKQAPTTSPPTISLVSKKPPATEAQAQTGLFTRLSTTFWSAVVRPTGPAEILPDPIYSESLRREIRSRYGVVSDQHPWTMTHMRTLHRLLNSCTSGKSDSIVPKSGPLPEGLSRLVGKKLTSVTPDFKFNFTEQHAHVVDAFMQAIVPHHISEAIKSGEMEFLGDSEAKKHRGLLAGRHGDMVVFTATGGVKEPTGRIEREWVVKAVGNCVMANIDTEERRLKEVERLRGIEEERLKWERKNGMVYDDDDGDESFRDGESSFLPKVQHVSSLHL